MFVDADGALAVVDFGIMGRLDRETRYYLADMLIGFLSGDYRRVAEVHFDAGYVPRRPLDRRLHPGLPLDRRADPRPAACTRSRSPACWRSCSTSPSSSRWRRSRNCCCCKRRWCWSRASAGGSTPTVNIWSAVAAAGRGMDARQSRPRGAAAPAHRHARSRPSTRCRGCCAASTSWSATGRSEGVVLHAESLATQAAHRARLLPLAGDPLYGSPPPRSSRSPWRYWRGRTPPVRLGSPKSSSR